MSIEPATGGALYKKVSLKISQNSQENTCARVSCLVKLQAKARALFLKDTSGWLLLCQDKSTGWWNKKDIAIV